MFFSFSYFQSCSETVSNTLFRNTVYVLSLEYEVNIRVHIKKDKIVLLIFIFTSRDPEDKGF